MSKKVFIFFLTVFCFFVLLYIGVSKDGWSSNNNEKKKATEQKDEKIIFDLEINKEDLDLFQNSDHPVVKNNDQLFGTAVEESSLQMTIHLSKRKTAYKTDKLIDYRARVNGKIINKKTPIEFTAEETISLITLKDGRQIYIGHLTGKPTKDSKGVTHMTISFRKDANSDDVDVSINVGIIGNSSLLLFGKPFLLDEEIYEYQDISVQNAISDEKNEE